MFDPIKPSKRPRIGLYAVGHSHYWEQFPGLLDRLLGYGRFIQQRMSAWGDVCNVGMIDEEHASRRSG
jgi:L-arabinose isomerase